MLLSDLSASGVPVDAHSIAAAMVVDAVSLWQIPMDVLHRELGMQVSAASSGSYHHAVSRTHPFSIHLISQVMGAHEA
jgi:uncharacterized membrane protein